MGEPRGEVGSGTGRGYGVAGKVGAELRREYNRIGIQVNNAAYRSRRRLARAFLSQNTYRQVADEVRATAQEPLILKGTTKPTPIYELDRA